MKDFITLTTEPGSEMDVAIEKIITKKSKKYIGQGGKICDVIYPFGGLKKQCNVSISLNKNKEEVVSIDGITIMTRDLEFYKFRFNNLDY